MNITYAPSERDINIKKIYCPECGEKLRNVGLTEGCHVEGLTFRCKRCHGYFKINVKKVQSAECRTQS